jgi:hypothetical protein
MAVFQPNDPLFVTRVGPVRPGEIGHCRVQVAHGETLVTALCLVPDAAPPPEVEQCFLVKNTSGSGGLSAELWGNARTDGTRYVLYVLPPRLS